MTEIPISGPSKRALLCGVSYKKQHYKLTGTINDVKKMKELLLQTFNFPEESIRVLSEEEADPKNHPTRKNILEAFKWLVDECESGDSLVFYFSGHGLRQPDFKKDEHDGFDETICPVDFRKEGMILDDDINLNLVRPLKRGVTLHAFVDACHSGTILDLSYLYSQNDGEWKDNKPPSGLGNKGTSGGLAICFSACEDYQIAVDTSALEKKEMNGAMTYSLVYAIKKNPQITYGQLLDSMHQTIEDANKIGCLCSILTHCITKIQDPKLSSSEEFDIYKKKVEL